MILIALGANLPGPAGPPLAQCEAALVQLKTLGIGLVGRSRWYETAPVPDADQPWFVNGIAEISTALDPVLLLRALHDVEAALGRRRSATNAPRTIDLDLLDYHGMVRPGPEPPTLPHPRLAERVFVLLPLAEIAPLWRHPVSGRTVAELVAALPERHSGLRRLDDGRREPT